MTVTEIISIISSIASLILAVLAIWLSIVFFRMADQASKETTEASRAIGANVERLEKLFDKLYSDTFSIMRDTVSDMRKHIWPVSKGETETVEVEREAEKKAEEKVTKIREEIDEDLAQILKSQQVTDTKLSRLRQEMSDLIDKAISQSRKVEVEARGEVIRNRIMSLMKRYTEMEIPIVADMLVGPLREEFNGTKVLSEMFAMKKDGLIDIESTRNGVRPDTKTRLIGSVERRRKSGSASTEEEAKKS